MTHADAYTTLRVKPELRGPGPGPGTEPGVCISMAGSGSIGEDIYQTKGASDSAMVASLNYSRRLTPDTNETRDSPHTWD
jgi:hypothetical protein